MIIGLVGLKGSGKDTVGAYLVHRHGFERRAFADPMKQAMETMLDIDHNMIETLKNDPLSTIMVSENGYMLTSITFRQFTQRFAEAFKPIMGEDVWANVTLPVDGAYGGRAIVVTDVRFGVEADRVTDLGGTLVRVTRPGLSDKDPHRSEVEQGDIITDFTIINNGSLDDLYEEIEMVLTNLMVEYDNS